MCFGCPGVVDESIVDWETQSEQTDNGRHCADVQGGGVLGWCYYVRRVFRRAPSVTTTTT